MGMVSCRGLSTMVIADPELFWECPDEFSLEDACTIPVTYGKSIRHFKGHPPPFVFQVRSTTV